MNTVVFEFMKSENLVAFGRVACENSSDSQKLKGIGGGCWFLGLGDE